MPSERQGRMLPLASQSPRLLRSWHPTRNGALRPGELTQGSGRYVWWQCQKGADHVWSAMVASRARGSGCPFCAGQRVSVTNCLATRFPAVSTLWHPTRNGRVSPTEVMPNSNHKAWWKCPVAPDHEWQAAISSVRSGCPFCSGRRLSTSTALAHVAPQVAAEWHPTRNRTLLPTEIHSSSPRLVWWKCAGGPDHEWRQSVRDRTRNGKRCPFCFGPRMSSDKSLAARCPAVAREWHPRKNGKLTVEELFWASHARVWWKCSAGPDHEWSTKCYQRTKASGCPFCSGRRASVTNSLAARFPTIASYWNAQRNGDTSPNDVRPGTSNQRYWWRCPEGHEFLNYPMCMTRGRPRCPVCRHRFR